MVTLVVSVSSNPLFPTTRHCEVANSRKVKPDTRTVETRTTAGVSPVRGTQPPAGAPAERTRRVRRLAAAASPQMGRMHTTDHAQMLQMSEVSRGRARGTRVVSAEPARSGHAEVTCVPASTRGMTLIAFRNTFTHANIITDRGLQSRSECRINSRTVMATVFHTTRQHPARMHGSTLLAEPRSSCFPESVHLPHPYPKRGCGVAVEGDAMAQGWRGASTYITPYVATRAVGAKATPH